MRTGRNVKTGPGAGQACKSFHADWSEDRTWGVKMNFPALNLSPCKRGTSRDICLSFDRYDYIELDKMNKIIY
jgi:hypothetical protein